jgi:hypothetical protein
LQSIFGGLENLKVAGDENIFSDSKNEALVMHHCGKQA